MLIYQHCTQVISTPSWALGYFFGVFEYLSMSGVGWLSFEKIPVLTDNILNIILLKALVGFLYSRKAK